MGPTSAGSKRAAALAAAMPEVPHGTVRGARVAVERGGDGKDRYTFRGIADDELEAFARAILAGIGKS